MVVSGCFTRATTSEWHRTDQKPSGLWKSGVCSTCSDILMPQVRGYEHRADQARPTAVAAGLPRTLREPAGRRKRSPPPSVHEWAMASLPLGFNFSCTVEFPDRSPAEVQQTDVQRGTRQDVTFFVFVRPQGRKPFSGALHLSGSSPKSQRV
jgi:hypothetical protein